MTWFKQTININNSPSFKQLNPTMDSTRECKSSQQRKKCNCNNSKTTFKYRRQNNRTFRNLSWIKFLVLLWYHCRRVWNILWQNSLGKSSFWEMDFLYSLFLFFVIWISLSESIYNAIKRSTEVYSSAFLRDVHNILIPLLQLANVVVVHSAVVAVEVERIVVAVETTFFPVTENMN